MQKDSLSVGIIGCGAIHRLHAEGISQSAHAVLTAVCDTDADKRDDASRRYGVPAYESYKALIENEDIDAVHICTPHYLHAPMAEAALAAGKHVLVEKPAAIDYSEGLALADAAVRAEAEGVYAGVCFQNRYNPSSIALKEALRENLRIKGIKSIVTWHRTPEYYSRSDWRGRYKTEGGGVLINQSIHTLDLMQLFGGPIRAVSAHVDTRTLCDVIEVEDTAEAAVFFQSGSVGLFYATNCYSSNSSIEIEIDLEAGQLRFKDGILYRFSSDKAEKLADDSLQIDGTGKSYWGVSHTRLIDEFYRFVTGDGGSRISVAEGIETLKLIGKIYESSRQGRRVDY
jgi:predicted dehydrogenase